METLFRVFCFHRKPPAAENLSNVRAWFASGRDASTLRFAGISATTAGGAVVTGGSGLFREELGYFCTTADNKAEDNCNDVGCCCQRRRHEPETGNCDDDVGKPPRSVDVVDSIKTTHKFVTSRRDEQSGVLLPPPPPEQQHGAARSTHWWY